jgi:vancomycin resistance protein YoaR
MEATLDGEKLHKRLRDELSGIERAGRDATVRIQGGKPVVVPARTGRSVDSEELGTAVFAVLPETSSDARTAVVTLTVSQPDLTTAEAKALNITEKLSSFRQAFVPAEYRYINVGEAARRLNGTILEPGETFSMNDTVKERTRANGYTEGFIISGGRFREELGGGVSIITTATWTAGFYAGLERVEQHPHGLYISRYQAGLEATVAWGLLDLRMRNETGNGVLITATRYSDGVLIEMWGTKKWEDVTATFTERRNYTDFQTIYDDGERCVPSEGVRGFSIAVTRRRINNGKSESTETFPTTYKPTPNVVCGPKP